MGQIDVNRMSADPDQWLNDMQARLADLKTKSEDLAQNLATATATVTSDDGAVTVTIAPTGALQNLELTQKAAGMSPGRLTASIMEAVGKGQRAASAKMVEAFAPLGAGTESMDLVLSYLPAADEDDEVEEHALQAVDALDDEPAPQPLPPKPFAPPPAAPAPPARPTRAQPDFEEDENHPW